LATTIYRNGLRCYLHKMTQIFAHLSLSFLLVYLVTYCFLQAKKYGSLQVVSQYYQLQCPARGSSLTFHPLDHLHPLRFHRPGETVLHIAGSTIDLRSCDTSLEVAEMRNALFAEEESTALSTWAVASICGCLRLEHVRFFAYC
jgi:hypothetical protein